MPTNKPEVVLPELPAITRYRVDGDIAYPVSEDPDGSMVDYDDHVAAMRAYGQACIDTLTRPADGQFGWRPIADAQLLVRDATGCSGPCAVLLKLNIARPGPFIRQGRFDIAAGGFVCDSTAQVLHDAVAFIEPQWAAPSAAPQQHGQEVGDGWEVVVTGWTKGDGKTLWLENDGEPMFRIGARGDIGTNKAIHLTGRIPLSTNDAQQPAEAVAWSVLQIGHHGAAYDPPNAKRAYTYDHQPDNIGAYRLGRAAGNAPQRAMGDNIDYGLVLLKCLQEEGYGVFQIGSSLPPPAIDIGKLRELVKRWRNLDTDFAAYKGCADELAALIGDGGERQS